VRVLRRIVHSGTFRTLGPFVPVVALWWLLASLRVFPEAFFVGPDRPSSSSQAAQSSIEAVVSARPVPRKAATNEPGSWTQ